MPRLCNPGSASAGAPFPSTYRAYPGVPTALVGATVFDGAGGRIERGTVLMAHGRIVAVGGPVLWEVLGEPVSAREGVSGYVAASGQPAGR